MLSLKPELIRLLHYSLVTNTRCPVPAINISVTDTHLDKTGVHAEKKENNLN